jgi:hypothetical protein
MQYPPTIFKFKIIDILPFFENIEYNCASFLGFCKKNGKIREEWYECLDKDEIIAEYYLWRNKIGGLKMSCNNKLLFDLDHKNQAYNNVYSLLKSMTYNNMNLAKICLSRLRKALPELESTNNQMEEFWDSKVYKIPWEDKPEIIPEGFLLLACRVALYDTEEANIIVFLRDQNIWVYNREKEVKFELTQDWETRVSKYLIELNNEEIFI